MFVFKFKLDPRRGRTHFLHLRQARVMMNWQDLPYRYFHVDPFEYVIENGMLNVG